MPTVLTIAGSDSSGGAGIQADLRTLNAIGVRGLTAVTAITAQHEAGITAIHPLPSDVVAAQIEAVANPVPDSTKIGMLANAAIVEAVGAAIEDFDLPLVVLDPVIASTSGVRLLDAEGVQTLLIELLPRVLVITPNIFEAEALSGRRIASLADVEDAAKSLYDQGAANVLIKGGHSKGDDVVDVLFDGRSIRTSRVARMKGPNVRGTGCSHASAIAAFLALGYNLADAAARAQLHVSGLIATYTE